MILGLYQMDCVWEDKQTNLKKVEVMAKRARDLGVDILILPEMFATGFSFDLSVTMEPEDGLVMSFLSKLAKENRIGILGGVVLPGKEGKARNSAVVFDRNGNLVGIYTKCHVFSYQQEELFHEPGQTPVILELHGTKITPIVCYDLRFPELLRPIAPLIHLGITIASWPANRQAHWDVLLRARAIENQCYWAGVNRVGEGGGLSFLGGSAVYDPWGECLIRAERQECLLVCEIEPKRVEEIRTNYPFLKDMKSKFNSTCLP
jgi:omega-amidase